MTSGYSPNTGARRAFPWLTVEGVVLVVLGVLALALPIAAGLAAALVVGWVLVIGGVFGLLATLAGRGAAHLGWGLLSSAAALLAGLLMLIDPAIGTSVLVLVAAVYLVVDGVATGMLALDHRRRGDQAWRWLAAVAVLDLIVGLGLGVLGPALAAAVVGVVIGIDLVLAGLAMIALTRSRAI